MRKFLTNPIFLLSTLCLGIIFNIILSIEKPSFETEDTAKREIPADIENKGGELLWESLSHQFVTSISPY